MNDEHDFDFMMAADWIADVPGLSDEDRARGAELIARLIAHRDHLASRIVGHTRPFSDCLASARREVELAR